ncbi:hypothetical protein IKP85_06660 [bacterium]|nr:hypothetical protein [bacterium]
MAYAVEPQIFTQFKGIRQLNGVSSGGVISAVKSKNVELIQTEIGAETGIKTMAGNRIIYSLPTGYKVIGIFQSVQDGVTYKFIYGENSSKGTLYYVNANDELVEVPGAPDFPVTGNCNGITMTSTSFDVFVFTNGKKFTVSNTQYSCISVCFSRGSQDSDKTHKITAKDKDNHVLEFLSMTDWNGFLVVADQYGIHASKQLDIETWDYTHTGAADSWSFIMGKKPTAVYSFTGGLYVFTGDDITFLSDSPNISTSKVETVAGLGCFSYQSILKHDTYLFFYDNKQKNIYYIENIDTGQIRPAGPVAKEIQSNFATVEKFKMFSCIFENKNQVWCLINDKIFIYDYFQQEWLQRSEQKLNAVCLIQNNVFTGGDDGVVYAEFIQDDFSGGYYPAEYETAFINLGTYSNIKKQKTPLLIVLNDNYVNDFYVQLTVNGKTKNPKHINISSGESGVYAHEEDYTGEIVPEHSIYDNDAAIYAAENVYHKKVVEVSTPQTWYTMGIRFYTDTKGQGFFINSIELKNIKMKNKTKGR